MPPTPKSMQDPQPTPQPIREPLPVAGGPKPSRRRRGDHHARRRALKRPEPKRPGLTAQEPVGLATAAISESPAAGTAAAGNSRIIRNASIIICFGALMSAIDTTVTNVALGSLEHDLHSSVASVQWVMTAYLLTVAGVIPVSGWASRRFGARQVYVVALGMFGISSGLCALAGSLQMLVASRLLQGLAGGMLLPLGQLIAAEVAGPSKIGRVISRVWTFSSIGSMLGPTIGGGILEALGWRWIFLINVPVSLIATVAAFYLLPQMPTRPAGKLDIGGLVRLSLGVPALVFALAQAEQSGSLLSPSAVIPMLLGIVLVVDFVRHARSSANPLLDIRLFKRSTLRTGLIAIFFTDLVWFGVLILLPLSFQQLRHASPMTAGALMAPQGVGTALGMWLSGRIENKRLARNIGAAGCFVMVMTTLVIAAHGATMPIPEICVTLFAAGFGAGTCWVPPTAACYIGLQRAEVSHASPMVAVVMRLGASFGTAIAAILLQANLEGGPQTGAHAIAAYHASFNWEASIGLFGALTYVLMCFTVTRMTRRTAAAQDTAEFAVQNTAEFELVAELG